MERQQRLSRLLGKLWNSGLLPKPRLSAILSQASKLADKLESAQAAPWRQPLDRLIRSLSGEARLNEVGLVSAYVQLKTLLARRERLDALWGRQPAIGQIRIDRPVIVLGQMRSGTTRLQRLLGCDRRFNHTRFFEVMDPHPRKWLDLRVAKSWAELSMLNALNPELRAVHPVSATSVEEVFGLFSFSLYGAQIEAQWHVPGFARYWEKSDRTWVYREFLRLLQVLAWNRGAAVGPWVLKAPQFMEDLDLLLELFPDARLICLHREAAEVVASSASLVWNQMRIQSDFVDRRWIGAEWLAKTARRARICADVRRANPQTPQIDVTYEAMNRDWRGEMRRIYAFLELELAPQVERRMESYLSRAERSGFRGHRYRLEDFGLDAAAVRNTVGRAAHDPI